MAEVSQTRESGAATARLVFSAMGDQRDVDAQTTAEHALTASVPQPPDSSEYKTAATGRTCLHCGLPLGGDAAYAADEFCCSGCCAAYQLISDRGLEEYYQLRRRFGDGTDAPIDPELAARSFLELDAPRFSEQHVQSLGDARRQVVLRLHGIHCAACVWLLERLPQLQPGVIDARVNLARGTIEISWQADCLRLSEVAHKIGKLGYRVVPLTSARRAAHDKQLARRQLVQIAIAGACSGNVMMIALAIYLGQWSGMGAEHMQLLRYACTAVGLVSLLGPGSVFLRGAWTALRTRTPHMDLPVALGLSVGAASGAWNTLAGSGELYFDSLSMLVFLLLIGRALQTWQQRSACDAVDLLQQLTPGTAHRVRDGAIETVPIEELQAGDTIEVPAGHTVPADGQVVMGSSQLDTSLLTGESLPQNVHVGQSVTAGTLNQTSTLRIRAERVGSQTRLSHLLDAIERASRNKAPVVQWADRASGVFVVAVLVVAALVGASWWWIDSSVWTERVIAVLIVACPCALGLATPLAVAVALGRAARHGVLIKGGGPLQQLASPGILVMDKTGTLTEGRLSIVDWDGDDQVLAMAAACEADNAHPVARAICEFARDKAVAMDMPISDVRQTLGGGVTGVVNGCHVVAGNLQLLRDHRCEVDPSFMAQMSAMLDREVSPVLIAIDGQCRAIASVADRLRSDARAVVGRLAERGWDVHIVSGDHPQIVRSIAREMHVPEQRAHGGVTPEEKLAFVQRCQESGRRVIMVGDGVNDAAALAAADVGIAVRGGAEASLQAADVYLANGSLAGIEQVMLSSRRTLRIIGRNAVASLLFNLGSVSLAALGWLHPLAAAILMPISSITVITVTLCGQLSRK